jgi:hypothetical protein
MKVINIGGKDYTFEFTIEASLYNECTEKVTLLMSNIFEAQSSENVTEIIKSIADIPQTSLSMFYAGLLENHGVEGDGSITSEKDAKKLIKQYFAEHKEDETGSFYGVMNLMLEIMGDDDFFKQIGLTDMATKAEEQKVQKMPQDHKKKTTRTAAKTGEK